MIRYPTDADYGEFTPKTAASRLWRKLTEDWECPACRRTKREILRWVSGEPSNWRKWRGKTEQRPAHWYAAVHSHHCHATFYDEKKRRIYQRFQPTTICQDCNNADAQAKIYLRLPRTFSFSPEEIAEFITSKAHDNHALDLTKAHQLFEQVKNQPIPYEKYKPLSLISSEERLRERKKREQRRQERVDDNQALKAAGFSSWAEVPLGHPLWKR